MGTYDDLRITQTVVSEPRRIAPADLDAIVAIGGYTHPLFTDPAYAARSPFGQRPVPGQGLLLLMGGMAERTGVFDTTTIGLAGFDAVRFLAPAFPGDAIRLEMEVTGKERDHAGRGVLVMSWRLYRDMTQLVNATARMLFA